MTCKACLVRGKTWPGSDPKCGFENGTFDGVENWNCATCVDVRSLCVTKGDSRIHHQCTENQHYTTVSLLDFDLLPYEDTEGNLQSQPVCLWVGWYKNRGRTEAMWLMFEYLPPRAPTEQECLDIIKHFNEHPKN